MGEEGFTMRCKKGNNEDDLEECRQTCECLEGEFMDFRLPALIGAIFMAVFAIGNFAMTIKLYFHWKNLGRAKYAIDDSEMRAYAGYQHSAGGYVVSPEATDTYFHGNHQQAFYAAPPQHMQGHQMVLVQPPMHSVQVDGVHLPVVMHHPNNIPQHVSELVEGQPPSRVAWPDIDVKPVEGQPYTVQQPRGGH